MHTYRISFRTEASVSIDVEADSFEDAVEKALYVDGLPTLCAQCAGWKKGYSLDLDDDWTVSDDAYYRDGVLVDQGE